MERYRHLHTFEPDYWIPGFPIELEKGAILFDTQTQTVLLQLKFWNCSSHNISSVHLSIDCYDDASLPLQPQEFRYMDLQVSPHNSFGEKIAIPLANSITRKVDISVTRVVLDNAEVVEEEQFAKIKKKGQPQSISTMDSHYIEEMELILNSKLSKNWKFIPCEIDESTWVCVCGKYNRLSDSACIRCGENREYLLELFSTQNLDAHYTERIELERQKEAKNLEVLSNNQLTTHGIPFYKKRVFKVISIALAFILVVGSIFAFMFKDNIKYVINEAYFTQTKQHYTDTIEKLKSSGLDSETSEELQECYYQLGILYLNANQYSLAANSFNEISMPYKDAESKLYETYYLWGKNEMKKENYHAARVYLEKANGYSDADSLLNDLHSLENRKNHIFD